MYVCGWNPGYPMDGLTPACLTNMIRIWIEIESEHFCEYSYSYSSKFHSTFGECQQKAIAGNILSPRAHCGRWRFGDLAIWRLGDSTTRRLHAASPQENQNQIELNANSLKGIHTDGYRLKDCSYMAIW